MGEPKAERAGANESTYFEMGPLASSTYRITRVVHDLRIGGRLTLARHRWRQIVNKSAAIKMWTVDNSPDLIFLSLENTHRPVTNIHRLQSYDYCNQTSERARCASVRQTNSHLPTRLARLDYKAFAERE